MGKRIFITGMAGFIGSHTAEAFKRRGDDVIGVDNLNDYYDPSQKLRNLDVLATQGIHCSTFDIRSEETAALIRTWKPDVIVHLAAMAGVRYSIEQPKLYMDVNVNGTQNILDAARDVKAYVVAASSSSVYGNRTDVPFRETDDVNSQISPYAASKRALELIGNVHHHITGLPISCLRFFTVYGPRGRPDMAPYKFMKAIIDGTTITQYGDGSTARDYTYVGDIVSGIVACADHPNGFQIYNLGNNTPVKLTEMIATIANAVGKQPQITVVGMQQGDVDITYADISKARNAFGYAPTTSFAEGMRKQYEWFKSEGLVR